MRLHDMETELFRLGCRFVGSRSSHHHYVTPGGRRFHVCGRAVKRQAQTTVWALLRAEGVISDDSETAATAGGSDNRTDSTTDKDEGNDDA